MKFPEAFPLTALHAAALVLLTFPNKSDPMNTFASLIYSFS